MAGHIRCSSRKCEKAMVKAVCSQCGGSRCHIVIYWHGKHYKFRKYFQDGEFLDYNRAIRQINVMRSQIDNKTFNPFDWIDSKISERKFVNKIYEWLEAKKTEMEADELAFATYKTYRVYVENYFVPFFEKWDVREIGYEQLMSFKTSLSKHSIKYRRCILSVLHSFYAWLKFNGTIKEVPQFPVIKGDDSKTRIVLEYTDQQDVLKRIPDLYKDPIDFLMDTGLRPGEICALKIKDIDIKNKSAVIQRTWSAWKIRETTKAKNKRIIPLSNRAVEVLQKHIIGKFPDDFIFKIKPKTLQKAWKKYSNLDISLYEATRHSFCTQIVEMGINSLQAQVLMRHSDIRTTQKYFHNSVTKLQDIVNRRGQILEIKKTWGENG